MYIYGREKTLNQGCEANLDSYICNIYYSKTFTRPHCYWHMILPQEAQSYLADSLLPYFEHKRYGLHIDTHQFIRRTNFGHSSALFTVSGVSGSFYTAFFLGIRVHAVEAYLAQLFGLSAYYHFGSHTLMVSWHHIWPSALLQRYKCVNERDLDAVADIFIDFMDEKGFDFLHLYRKSDALCKLLNDHSEEAAIWTNHSYQHIFRSLAMAFMNNRPDRFDLYLSKRAYLLKRGFGQSIIEKFEQMYQSLMAGEQLKHHESNY